MCGAPSNRNCDADEQVLAAADACEADATQAAAENLQLTAGRRDTWDRQQAQTGFELSTRIEQLRTKVSAAAPAKPLLSLY